MIESMINIESIATGIKFRVLPVESATATPVDCNSVDVISLLKQIIVLQDDGTYAWRVYL